jgi:hypothetical protein
VDLPKGGPVIDVTLKLLGSSVAALDQIRALESSSLTDETYYGGFILQADLNRWQATARCSGKRAHVELDPLFNQYSSDASIIAYIHSIDGLTEGYTLDQNAVASTSEVARRVALIHTASNKPVSCLVDYNQRNDAPEIASTFGCDRYIPGYYPEASNRKYGPVNGLVGAGQLSVSLDGSNAITGVKAFGWVDSESADAARLGFTTLGRPSLSLVSDMTRLVHVKGMNNVMIVTLGEPSADTGYLSACAAAVSKALS